MSANEPAAKRPKLHPMFQPRTAAAVASSRSSARALLQSSIKNIPLKNGWGTFKKTLMLWRSPAADLNLKSTRVAAFDFDGCLTHRRTGVLSLPRDLTFANVPDVMRAYHAKGYRVAILTNEVDIGRFKNHDPVLRAVNKKISRLETFVKHVNIPVEVLVATGYDEFRKQSTKDRRKNPPVGGIGFWKFLKTDLTGYGFEKQPREELSFFVGDAAGRFSDHSDADKNFAEAAGLAFFTPEQFFEEKLDPISVGSDNGAYSGNNVGGVIAPSVSANKPVVSKLSLTQVGPPFILSPAMPPTLVVLVGLMGAGKTTLGERLVARLGAEQCVRFSQDQLGARKKVMSSARAALEGGKRLVIIDRTNVSVEQRQHWTELANEIGVRCVAVVMTVAPETCVDRLAIRQDHEAKKAFPTDPNKIKRLLKMFVNKWTDVTNLEGFSAVLKCPDSCDDQMILTTLSSGDNTPHKPSSTASFSSNGLAHNRVGEHANSAASTIESKPGDAADTPSVPGDQRDVQHNNNSAFGVNTIETDNEGDNHDGNTSMDLVRQTDAGDASLSLDVAAASAVSKGTKLPNLHFSSVSTDDFKFPPDAAAAILVEQVTKWLNQHPGLAVQVCLVEPAMIKNEHNPFVSSIDTAIHGGGYVSASVPGAGVGVAQVVSTDPRFVWTTGQLVEANEELIVIGVGCTPRFKAGGDTANAALHRAIDQAVGGKHYLYMLTKEHMSGRLGQVGNAYIVPVKKVALHTSASTSASASSTSAFTSASTSAPANVVDKIHSIIHVLGPNCNIEKQDYVEDVDEAAKLLRASYDALFSSYGRVLEQHISQQQQQQQAASNLQSTPLAGAHTSTSVRPFKSSQHTNFQSTDNNTSAPTTTSSASTPSVVTLPLPSIPIYSAPNGRPPAPRGGWTNGLKQYFDTSGPDPPQVFLRVHSHDAVVIYDGFPKAKVHLLAIPVPFINSNMPPLKNPGYVESITMLRTEHLLALRKIHTLAGHIATKLCKDSPELIIRIGYHAVPSMAPLHLHIISQDFDSASLKHKKHWNSFTASGFFLDAVLVEEEIEKYGSVVSASSSKRGHLDELMKQELVCHRCGTGLPNMPKLKDHIGACHVKLGVNVEGAGVRRLWGL